MTIVFPVYSQRRVADRFQHADERCRIGFAKLKSAVLSIILICRIYKGFPVQLSKKS